MTYPPQQGPQDWQQPSGYGQLPPYPQQQGYPQQGYPPQQGGYGQPPKGNTGMIVGIIVAVTLVLGLGTLGITGFVAPGFFLSDDDDDDDEPTQPTGQPQQGEVGGDEGDPPTDEPGAPASSGEAAARTIDDFLGKVNAGDRAGAEQLVCEVDSGIALDETVGRTSDLHRIDEPTDDTWLTYSDVEGAVGGAQSLGTVWVESFDDGASWCIEEFYIY